MASLVDAYSNGKDVRTDQTMQDEIDAIDDLIAENKESLRKIDVLILEDIQKSTAVPHTIWDYVI
jgi:chromosomal replication initiation ATPase DnaA